MSARKRKGALTGISITETSFQVSHFDPKSFQLRHTHTFQLPPGLLNQEQILNAPELTQFIKQALNAVRPKVKSAHLTIAPTLLRLVEMPKMDHRDLYLSLSSEAERYVAFDNTEAIVDFEVLPSLPNTPNNAQRVIFGAVRKDTFDLYRQIFHRCKVKLTSLDLNPCSILRAMAGSGVLDSLVTQIGETAFWGTVFMGPEHTHCSLWQGSNLIEFREINLNTQGLETESMHSPIVEDLLDELKRTISSHSPAIWLTHQVPDVAMGAIQQLFKIPVRQCLLGPNLNVDTPDVLLTTAGASLYSYVVYPFNINFLAGTTASAPVPDSETPAESAQPNRSNSRDNGLAGLLISGAVVSMILLTFLTGSLFLYEQLIVNGQLSAAEQKHQQLTAQMGALQQQVQALKKKYEVRAAVVGVIEQAKFRNALYTHLSDDLKALTPGRLWLYNVEVGDRITMQGKALQHQPVIDFARQLDNITYSKQVLFDEITEELDNAQKVFKFKISGQPFLSKALVDLSPTDASQTDTQSITGTGGSTP